MFILISLLILFLLSFQGYVVSKESTKTIEGQYYQTIVENMNSISVNLSNYLNYIDDFARTLSNNPDLLNVLQHHDTGTKQKTEEQIRLFSEYYHLRLPLNIQVFNDQDDIFAYPSLNLSEESSLKAAVSTFPWFEQRIVLDNSFLHWNVAPDFHNQSSSNVLYVSKNIILNDHSLGLLVMELNGTSIERMLNRARIDDKNPIFIFSGDMQTLFHSDHVPSPLSEDSGPLRDDYQEMKLKLQNQDAGSMDIQLSGQNYRLLYKQVSSTPWTMVSLIPSYLLHSGSTGIWRITAIMMGVSFLFILLFFFILYTKVTLPVQHLSRIVRSAGDGRPPIRYSYKGFKEIETLNLGIFQFIDEIQQQVQTIKRGEGEKMRLELHMLQEQMRPHFWHNSLNSLRFLAVLHGDHTMSEAILSLSKMLDYTLKNAEVLYSTLEGEKDYAMSYVRFQEIRSMQRIRVDLDLDELSLDALIPKFTIQPLVENAIMHGFASPFEGEPLVRITARLQDRRLIVSITDNGNGIDSAALGKLFHRRQRQTRQSSGLSLINLQQRFLLEYGEPYGISIESEPAQFTEITIILPYQTADNEKEGNAS
ncbi:sensor histidine kinase [Paenibacillus sepulcri]|uniref:Histidine kinase n=1 Tax=Paenibacillus sepulcri TaxID=359917 RepID=A0ABS7C6D7_9BACL|nr:histidine kinase [Paenibacillus sepulcri]